MSTPETSGNPVVKSSVSFIDALNASAKETHATSVSPFSKKAETSLSSSLSPKISKEALVTADDLQCLKMHQAE